MRPENITKSTYKPPRWSKHQRSAWTAAAGLIFALVAIVLVVRMLGSSSQADVATPDRRTAYIMSQTFLEDHLNAPSSASFPAFADVTVLESSPGLYLVHGWVEASNAFGVPLRRDYLAQLRHVDGTTQWRCDYLELDGEVLKEMLKK